MEEYIWSIFRDQFFFGAMEDLIDNENLRMVGDMDAHLEAQIPQTVNMEDC